MRTPIHLLTFLALLLPTAHGQEIGFEEEFALATDRSAALQKLIPGTVDYYYFHCLHNQNTGQLERVAPLLRTWTERHGRGRRVEEIENRQALLGFDGGPARTIEYLVRKLGLRFDHKREIAGEDQALPERLAAESISVATLSRRARSLHKDSLAGFEDSMLESLAATQLSDKQLMQLLRRLRRPDVPNLPSLLVRNLGTKASRGFGSLAIHKALLLDQLEACLSLRPMLLNEPAFVSVYLKRLAPDDDASWREDASQRGAYLDRLWSFARRLTPAHNALKSYVLQHRLVHDLAAGAPDRDRLLEFLRLPRRSSYVNPTLLKSRRNAEIVDDEVERGYASTLLGFPGNDEPLVRAYLEHFFRGDSTYEPFAEYVDKDYLRRAFAETKILAGLGDMERWYSLLDNPLYYEQLEQRVEIEFPPTQRTRFARSEMVALEVDTKNVDTLLVKVFKIDALTYAMEEGREVDASIDLDGLVAGSETTYTYEDNALRRIRRRFEFPSLSQPGVYVVDLIGAGLSSRAVINKGSLQLRERVGAAGHVFQVLDEGCRPQADAAILFGGRRYETGEEAEIVVPYTDDAGPEKLVLQSGELVAVESFYHREEKYSLSAGIYVDRESLLSGGRVELLLRPRLEVNGALADISLLEEPVLRVTAHLLNGARTSSDVRGIELRQDRELVHELQVPEGATDLEVSLSGRIEVLSLGDRQVLESSSQHFALNGINASEQVDCPLLGLDDAGYFLDVLGKNGEPKASRVVTLALRHRSFRDEVRLQLKTNERGRVLLGELPGVTSVQASGLPQGFGHWRLTGARHTGQSHLYGTAGQALRLPYSGEAEQLTRAQVSLLELRGETFVRDRFAHVSLADGFVELKNLPPGNYDLLLKESGRRVLVGLTSGEPRTGWAVGSRRALELPGPTLHLTRAALTPDGLEVQLTNPTSNTRVHVFTTRFLPAYDAYGRLGAREPAALRAARLHHPASTYHSGRQISDEYRYILERRFARKYPGNMLERPGLLLNPWALEESDTVVGTGGGAGGKFGGRAGGGASAGRPEKDQQRGQQGREPGTFPSLDFLPSPSAVLINLRPDESGIVRVPADQLGEGALVRVVVVDEQTLIEKHLRRTQAPLVPEDQRLTGALEPTQHYSERRRIELLDTGQSATLRSGAGNQGEIYDSLADVFRLYGTLNADSGLDHFAFLLRWPDTSEEDKRAAYSESACHELNVFLYYKDPLFFGRVVRPYLANKADKTFIDRWLLDMDLSVFLDPWEMGRLNTFERILLGRRIQGRRGSIARQLREWLELSALDAGKSNALYDMTLAGAALTVTGSDDFFLGLRRKKFAKATPPGGAGGSVGNAARVEEVEEAEIQDAEAAEMLGRDRRSRARVRQLYSGPGRTKRYVEHNYWHLPIERQTAALIEVNSFWMDLAEAEPGQPFHSTHFAQASGNAAEMLMALAVLDLPFQAGEHTTARAGDSLTLSAASPLLLVRKELAPADPPDGTETLLVGQQFYRLDDRYRPDGDRQRELLVKDEFLLGVPYGCRVVATNPSPDPVRLELLLQIPSGAIPIASGFETRGLSVQLAPYATHTIEYAFYFPAAGHWTHYPAHATREGRLLAAAPPAQMNVVAKPTSVDDSSWEHISQDAAMQELLAFLEANNLLRVDLERLAWRMAEQGSYERIIALLRSRHTYNHTLWSYGLLHGDTATAREYLRHADGFVANCGPWLDTPLLSVDPIVRRAYQRAEFRPLFNARAHPFGKSRELPNRDLAVQYGALMDILVHKPSLDDTDWMSVTYHLLLQGRVGEALKSFARVDPGGLPMRIQYDYMRAYMDFFSEEHALAGEIASQYSEHPVPRWRDRFRQVRAHLDEAQGLVPKPVQDQGTQARNDALAAEEPTLELSVEDGRVTLQHRNLGECEVRYYLMDVEFLFSTNPFVQQGAGAFSYVEPNHMQQLDLPQDGEALGFELPEELRAANVLVEARAGGLVRRRAHYANSLRVQMIESFGQLKVTHSRTDRPLSRVYVKVFSKDGTQVRFHKDGYTDLRGRFDYVSVSGVSTGSLDRFAILVLSEQDGAVIREARPPQ